MGWFGFGGSRSRDERTRAHARSEGDRAESDWSQGDRSQGNWANTRFVHEAIRIDRAGKPSRLLDDRPRRLDREERRGRR